MHFPGTSCVYSYFRFKSEVKFTSRRVMPCISDTWPRRALHCADTNSTERGVVVGFLLDGWKHRCVFPCTEALRLWRIFVPPNFKKRRHFWHKDARKHTASDVRRQKFGPLNVITTAIRTTTTPNYPDVTFRIRTFSAKIHTEVTCVPAPCILLGSYQRFAARYWLHFLGIRMFVRTSLKHYITQARRPKCKFFTAVKISKFTHGPSRAAVGFLKQ